MKAGKVYLEVFEVYKLSKMCSKYVLSEIRYYDQEELLSFENDNALSIKIQLDALGSIIMHFNWYHFSLYRGGINVA